MTTTTLSITVKKSTIAENGDYNLTGNRYREAVNYTNVKWEMVELGEVCDVESGSRQKGGALKEGIPSIGGEQIHSDGSLKLNKMKYVSEEYFGTMKKGVLKNGDVLVVKDGATTGKTGYFSGQFKKGAVNEHVFIFRAKHQILSYFLFKAVQSQKFQNDLQKYIKGIIGGISLEIKQIKIPLPPLEVQEQIVAEIEQYQKVIDGAKQVVANWKPTIKFPSRGVDSEAGRGGSWEMVELGDMCEFNPKKSEVKSLDQEMLVSFVPMADLNEHQISFEVKERKKLKDVYSGYTYFSENDVLLARVTPCFENGKSGIAKNLENKIGFGSSEYFVYRPDQEQVLSEWIYYFISSSQFIENGKNNMSGTGGLQRLTKEYGTSYKIPLPPLAVQEQIVAEIEAEQKAVEECKKLIEKMQQKIEAKIGEVWGEEV